MGCIISEDKQNNWVATGTQAEMVGKKKMTENFHLKYPSASWKSSVCSLHLRKLSLGVVFKLFQHQSCEADSSKALSI